MASAKKLPSGNWRVLKYTGTENGKRKYASYTAPTRKEAEYLAAMGDIESKNQQKIGITVGEAIDRYIEAKGHIMSPATIHGYKSLRRNAYESIIATPVSSLTQELVQRAINEYAAGHTPKTTRNANGLLSAALTLQCGKYFRISLPQKDKKRITIPTTEQVSAMLKETKDTPMELAILFAAMLGLRRSEICALTRSNVDLHSATITITQAMVKDDDGIHIIKRPKSVAGTRTLSIPPPLMDVLRHAPSNEQYIVPLTPAAITARFSVICRRLNIACRFHDLRHYNASLMLALGVPDKYAMQRMGHATPNMLKSVYQHLMDDKQQEVERTINNKLSKLFIT